VFDDAAQEDHVTTASDAIREALRALGGEASVAEVSEWIEHRYPLQWARSTIGTTMADLTFPGNRSSRFSTNQRILRRVGHGRYRLS
jgi:hypothetical protein